MKKAIAFVKSGGEIVFNEVADQYGNQLPTELLTYENGHFVGVSLNCYAAESVGMGTCQCVNHPTWKSEIVSEEEALEIIRRYIEVAWEPFGFNEHRAERFSVLGKAYWTDRKIKAYSTPNLSNVDAVNFYIWVYSLLPQGWAEDPRIIQDGSRIVIEGAAD